MTKPFISFDSETGGTRPAIHPLLSMAAVASWSPDAPFVAYVLPAPDKVIDPEAAAINGYSPTVWAERGAVSLHVAMLQFVLWLSARMTEQPEAAMVAHNAGFDRSFLDEAAAITGTVIPGRHSWRCSMALFGELMDLGILPRGRANLDRLGELSGQWPVGGRPAVHDVLQDAQACARGYQWLQDRLQEWQQPKLLTTMAEDLRRAQSALDGILPHLAFIDSLMSESQMIASLRKDIFHTFTALGTTPEKYRAETLTPLSASATEA